MPGLPLNTTKNRGRPGRSGDVVGRSLGHGYVSLPTHPRSRNTISTVLAQLRNYCSKTACLTSPK